MKTKIISIISVGILVAVSAIFDLYFNKTMVISWNSVVATIDQKLSDDITTRQFARLSIGGSAYSFKFSNKSGVTPLKIDEARVAIAGRDLGSIDTQSDTQITFDGKPHYEVPPGGEVISDLIALHARPLRA